MGIDFNETTNNSGLLQTCETWLFSNNFGSITDDTELVQTFTNLINRGVDKSTVKVFQADSLHWSYDDSSHGGLAENKQNLVADQKAYTVAAEQLISKGVYILDQNGDYYPIYPINEQQINAGGMSPDEYYDVSGLPVAYEITGNQLQLYPAPTATDTTLTNGLKLTYKRNSEYFATTDTTKETGLPEPFQELPALYACYDYAMIHNLTKQGGLAKKIKEMEDDMQNHFRSRDSFRKPRISMKVAKAN